MNRFADLLDRLVLTPQRNGKLRLIAGYLSTTPDPDRGYAMAAIGGALEVPAIRPGLLRALVAERVDAELFAIAYDYVGDLAETVSLIWPQKPGPNRVPGLAELVVALQGAGRAEAPRLIEDAFDALDAQGRWALVKLVTGGFRIGVGPRLVKTALGALGGRNASEIEELWHGLSPPYTELFAWLEGRGPRPTPSDKALFRPVMLAHALGEDDLNMIDPAAFLAEWKWDGARVQAVGAAGERRLYSRSGDDIGAAFPDILARIDFDATIDGEILIFDPKAEGFQVRPFSDLQQRLNRRRVSARMMSERPAFIRAYDLLTRDGEDLRPLPFVERRRQLEAFMAERAPSRFDLSPLVPFTDLKALIAMRTAPPAPEIEGLMLKRAAAPYTAGRPRGDWWKWKRAPFAIDAVLLYAQRGHGKRSSLYSDFTFGVWADDGALVPVGKAYSGFTDEELKRLDRFVREHTIDRFGPVRAVAAKPETGIVLEIAFEGLNRSTRHKSGVAMRFPRIARIRWDKPPREADHLATLIAMLP